VSAEQIHLTWGNDPATTMVVSWASPGPAVAARVLVSRDLDSRHRDEDLARMVKAVQRTYTDGLNGETVWTYHAELDHHPHPPPLGPQAPLTGGCPTMADGPALVAQGRGRSQGSISRW
jgi:hypothetical protein